MRALLAWSVHLLTASGGVLGLAALAAVADGRPRAAFAWLGAACLVDGVDGPLARVVRARQALPWFDGTLLDNLVDYLTYAVVPAFLVARLGFLPEGLGAAGAAAIVLAAAYQFSRVDAKTGDHFFLGFPSYWNFVAFYLWILAVPPAAAAVVIAALVVLSFVPVRFVYPTRTERLRSVTLALASVWAVALAFLLLSHPERHPALAWGTLAFPAYYFAASLALGGRR